MRNVSTPSCFCLFGWIVGLLALSLNWANGADDRRPSPVDRITAKQVAKLIQERHLSRRPLDDEAAKRAFELYIKSLDSAKVYFTQADVDAFSGQIAQIDDMVIKGDVSLAFAIFERFVQRVDERVAM